MKKEDNVDFIWYITSLIASGPEAVYNEYIQATDDPTTKTIVFSNALDFNKYLDIYNYFAGRIRISAGIGTNLTNDTEFKPAIL